MRYTGDCRDGRLLGLQLVGRFNSEIAKRIDVDATAIFNSMTVEAVSNIDLLYARRSARPGKPLTPAPKPGPAALRNLTRRSRPRGR
jgi:hypothetical protein